MKFTTLIAWVFTVFLALGLQASADNHGKKLTVGWTEIAPLFKADDHGNPAGFGTDVIRDIAGFANLDLEFVKFPDAESMIRAQAAGDIDLLPAIAALPFFSEQNLFSDPVAETHMRVFVRTEDSENLHPESMAGMKVGIPSVPLGPEGEEFLSRNIATQTAVGTLAITELLRGNIDALISADAVAISDAHELRIEHRIVPVGPPIQRFDRVITVNRSHRELLEPINQAIRRLEEDGTLKRLREIHAITIPPPPPDVLKVGVYHFPPYNVVEDDGFTGFSVETFRDLARLAGLKIELIEITREEWGLGPGPDRYDIITQAGISADRLERMDFTIPVRRNRFSIFVAAGNPHNIADVDDLVGLRVGVEEVNLGRRLAQREGNLNLHIYQGDHALLDALISNDVDAIIFPRKPIRELIKATQTSGQVTEISKPAYIVERAPALRFGLGEVRERLNAVIPGYLISDEHSDLVENWLRNPYSWTSGWLRSLLIAATAIVILIILIFTAFSIWRSRRQLNERRRFASELIENLPIGLLLISPEGRIEYANSDAKRQTPFGAEILVEGQNYKKAIKALIEKDIYNYNKLSKKDLFERLTGPGLSDGYHEEFSLADGRAFIRTAKHLSNGSVLLVRHDVTEARARIAEIEGLNTQLEQQVKLANAVNDELRAFAYATSHDLKAPVNTSGMLIDALFEKVGEKLDGQGHELLQDLKTTSTRMAALIEDILHYTRFVGGDATRTEVELNAVLAEVLDNLSADLDATNSVITHTSLPSVLADATQMRQLLQNLITNAVKFRLPGKNPKINVSGEMSDEGLVTLKVADNGIGIPQQYHQRIFGLFSRLNRREDYEGTGLGLAICQRVVLNHGGRITVHSMPGKGTTFTVTLEARRRDKSFDADRR